MYNNQQGSTQGGSQQFNGMMANQAGGQSGRLVGREEANRLYAQGVIGPNGPYAEQSRQLRQQLRGQQFGGGSVNSFQGNTAGQSYGGSRNATPSQVVSQFGQASNPETLYTFGNVNTYGRHGAGEFDQAGQYTQQSYGNNQAIQQYGNTQGYQQQGYFPGNQQTQYGDNSQVTDSNRNAGLGNPTVYGVPIVAVRKNDRDIQAFQLANGTVLDYAQMIQAHSEGEVDKLIFAPNREGELTFRSTPDGISSNNLDNLPQF